MPEFEIMGKNRTLQFCNKQIGEEFLGLWDIGTDLGEQGLGFRKLQDLGRPVDKILVIETSLGDIFPPDIFLEDIQSPGELLWNAFSKKLENLQAAAAPHFFHYNFMRIHKSLSVTPAMESALTKHIWTWEEFLGVNEARKIAV